MDARVLFGPAPVLAAPAVEFNLLSVKAGLDPNVRFSQRSHHILLSLMDMVQNARSPKDLNFVYSLTLTLLQVHTSEPVSSNDGKHCR